MTLTQIANKLELDKGTADASTLSWHSAFPDHVTMGYTEVYEKFMAPMRKKFVRLLEVGVCDSRFPLGSLQMWIKYFPKGTVIAMDLFQNPEVMAQVVEIGCTPVMGDQSDGRSYERIHGPFDFIIEDGSHQPDHMLFSLAMLSEKLAPKGIYFMEDIQNERTRGMFGYDNLQCLRDLQNWQNTGVFTTALINAAHYELINRNLRIVGLHPALNDAGWLGVFSRK
jgi:hypothetical protein